MDLVTRVFPWQCCQRKGAGAPDQYSAPHLAPTRLLPPRRPPPLLVLPRCTASRVAAAAPRLSRLPASPTVRPVLADCPVWGGPLELRVPATRARHQRVSKSRGPYFSPRPSQVRLDVADSTLQDENVTVSRAGKGYFRLRGNFVTGTMQIQRRNK